MKPAAASMGAGANWSSPAHDGDSAPDSRMVKVQSMTPEARRILLVDYDVDFVEMNRRILEAKGYRIEAAYDAEEALGRCSWRRCRNSCPSPRRKLAPPVAEMSFEPRA